MKINYHFIKKVKKFTSLFKKLYKRKVVFFSVVSIIFVSVCIVIALIIPFNAEMLYQKSAYKLTINNDKLAENIFAKDKKITFGAQITTLPAKGFTLFHKPSPVVLTITVNKEVLYENAFTLDEIKGDTHSISIPLDISLYADGEFPVTFTLRDKTPNNNVFTTQSTTLIIDTKKPQLEEVTSENAYISRYSLNEGKNASEEAKLGVSITTNKKESIPLTFSFSEKGTLKTDISEASGSATIITNATSEAKVTLSAKINTWKAPFIFSDVADNNIKGELNFVYDAIPPKINAHFDHRVDKNAKNSYFLTFTASEPLAFAKATLNGTTKFATGTYKAYRVDGLPLNDDKNLITITGRDLAGNSATAQVQVSVVELRRISFEDFGKASSFKRCSDEDHKACGFPPAPGCDSLKKYQACMKARCDNVISIQNCD